jgi:transcriptional regulator with XRE-family HTH domain
MRWATEDAVRLGQLREARRMTQAQVAQALSSSQPNVSKLERREDLYLSTLSEYVEALGGRLEIRAVFPDEVITIDVARASEPASTRSQG